MPVREAGKRIRKEGEPATLRRGERPGAQPLALWKGRRRRSAGGAAGAAVGVRGAQVSRKWGGGARSAAAGGKPLAPAAPALLGMDELLPLGAQRGSEHPLCRGRCLPSGKGGGGPLRSLHAAASGCAGPPGFARGTREGLGGEWLLSPGSSAGWAATKPPAQSQNRVRMQVPTPVLNRRR